MSARVRMTLLPAALSVLAACGSVHPRHVTDGMLDLSLPHGWSSSIGPGHYAGQPEAWLLVADFALPADAARHEGRPPVPRGKVLITIGDFVPAGSSLNWPRVSRLSLRSGRPVRRVRFQGRAVWLQLQFGPGESLAGALARANSILGSVRPAPR